MSCFNDDAMSLHSLVVQDALDRQSELVDVRADGYEAAQKGQQASDCPHPRLSGEHSAWMSGFDAGLGVPVITEEILDEHNAYVERDAFRSAAEKAIAERDALRAVLREIVTEWNNTYDVDMETDGSWRAAATIPVEVMQRAEKLLGEKP